jgi:HTTM domain
MTTLGLARIAFGLLILAWTFGLLPNLLTMFGPQGALPRVPSTRYSWGLLHVFGGSNTGVVVVWLLLLAAALALTVGWHSRLAALIVYICVLSFERRDIYVFNSGDVVLRVESLYVMLAPCGSALSLDRRRTAGSFWSAQVRAPWGLRLLQVQMSVIYITTVHDKLGGPTWNQGTAVSYALRLTQLQAIPVPHWISTNPELMNIASWGTLVLEISLGVLVWNRRIRPWLLCAGVVMHLIFVATLAVAFFSFAMYILYLSFLSVEAAGRFTDRVRGALPRPLLTALDRPKAAASATATPAARPGTDPMPADDHADATEPVAEPALDSAAAADAMDPAESPESMNSTDR